MREELRRNNAAADNKGLLFFSKAVLGKSGANRDSVRQLCALQNDMRIRFDVTVALFEYLELLTATDRDLSPTEQGKNIFDSIKNGFEQLLCKICLTKIAADELVDMSAIKFDTITGQVFLQNFAFHLSAAIFRNLLIQLGAITERSDGTFAVDPQFEQFFETTQKRARRKMTLESLKATLERQEEQGRAAEEFVVNFERRRLVNSNSVERVKRISDFDVTAGYDIVSFENEDSKQYDRFIEVKSFASSPQFHWSFNEIEVAKLLDKRYYIYLVDANRLSEETYIPIIIANPANTVINSDGWLLNATSYLVIPTDVDRIFEELGERED